MENKKKKQTYKVNVYLGKKNYQTLKELSDYLKMPIATIVRVTLDFGLDMTIKSGITKELFKNE
nr:unnamed protein product [uncultured bacterium]